MPFLRIETSESPVDFELGDRTVIGRDPEADIVLDDTRCSKRHCRVERDGRGRWRVTDLASSNGTQVDGAQISQVSLENGMEIVIGATRLTFHRRRPAAEVVAPGTTTTHHDAGHVARTPSASNSTAPSDANADAARTPRRRRRPINMGAIVAVAILAGGLYVVSQRRNETSPQGPSLVDQVRTKLDEAFVHRNEGRWDEAVAAFDAVVELRPKSREATAARDEAKTLRRDIELRSTMRQGFARLVAEAGDEAPVEAQWAFRRWLPDARRLDADLARRMEDKLTAMQGRLRYELARRRAEVQTLAAEHVAAGRFGAASSLWETFKTEARQSGEDAVVTEARREHLTVMKAARAHWEQVLSQSRDLADGGRFDEAATLLAANVDRLRGTNIERLARTESQAMKLRRAAPVTAARAETEITPATTSTSTSTSTNAVAVSAPTALVTEAERLAGERKWSEAAERYRAAIEVVTDDSVRTDWGLREEALTSFARLEQAVIDGIAENRRSIKVGRLRARPVAADKEKVRLEVGRSGSLEWTWTEIPGERLVELFGLVAKEPDDKFALALVCRDLGMDDRAEEMLADLTRRPGFKARADHVVARWRGVTVPPGGFELIDRRFFAPDEAERVRELAHAEKLAAKLVKAKADRFQEYATELESMSETVVPVFVDALRKRWDGLDARLADLSVARQAGRTRSKLAPILEKRREAAFALIFDNERYPYPYGPNQKEVQAEVNELVAEVREIYETPSSRLLEEDEGLQALFAEASEIATLMTRYGAANLAPTRLLRELDRHIDMAKASRSAGANKYAEEVAKFNAEIKSSITPAEREVHRLTNEYRMLMGRRPVKIEEALVLAARGHSQEMKDLGYFAHNSPTEGRRTPSQRAQLSGWGGSVSENIARGQSTAAAAVNGWINSSGHHRNILGRRWTHLGVGKSEGGYFWTQNFASGSSTSLSKEKIDPKAKDRDQVERASVHR